MPAPGSSLWRSAVVPATVVVLGGLLVVAPWRRPASEPDTPAPFLHMDDWSLADLIRYLEGQGLGLRAVPTWKGGRIIVNAFLVRGEKPWEELAGLPKSSRDIHRWRGVVFCERVENATTAELRAASWEGACLRADPFVFFGDPQLLALIRATLQSPPETAATEEGARRKGASVERIASVAG